MEFEDNSILNILGYTDDLSNKHQKIFTRVESISRVNELVDYLKDHYRAYVQCTELDEQVFLITIPQEIHNSVCILQFEIKLNFIQHDMKIMIILMDQDGKILVKEKNTRNQLLRYMLRLNNNLRVGSFFINPIYGYVGLKLQCYSNIEEKIFASENHLKEFYEFLDSIINTGLQTLRFYFLRILILMNRIKIENLNIFDKYMQEIRYSEGENKTWRKVPPNTVNLLQRIKSIISNDLHKPFEKHEYEQYGPIIQKQIQAQSKVMKEIKVNPQELQLEKCHEINSGGFSVIYAKEIAYTCDDEKIKQFKKHFAIKVDNKDDQKIQKEIKILQHLSKAMQQQDTETNQNIDKNYFEFAGKCPYIAQFYNLKERSDILLMDRYQHSSLDYFMSKYKATMSLSTKLFLAHSIAMGIRYCHFYGIIHMDIKPANILIPKSLLAKITDFGESINLNNVQFAQQVKQQGRTFPYCAPEIMKPFNIDNITEAYDIFSFGMVLFELIFERYPIDFRKENLKVLEQKYLNWNYSVRYNEEYDKTLGPQKLMKYLGRLCLACLQPNPKNRPNIDKIILILKDSLSYLDRMY